MPKLDPTAQRDFAREVVAKLRAAGFEAYWAGGCVRDRLLGRVPKDYDVATAATPDQVRQAFGARRTLAIGAAFGVMTVVGPKPAGQVEVATFRCDAEYSDGRRPDSVTFSSAREDALRRDFSINGMFFDPLTEEVIDYVGGQTDLENHILRAIGDPAERIREDKLRMLRAVRFAAHFGFSLEESTAAAIQRHAPEVCVVSAERISQELRRMWTDPHRVRGFELLQETQLLFAILPEVAALSSLPKLELAEGLCDRWHYTLRVFGTLESPDFALAAAGALHAIAIDARQAASMTDQVGRRLRWARKEIEDAKWLVARQLDWNGAQTAPWPRLQRLLIAPLASELLSLAHAMALTGRGALEDVAVCRAKLALPAETLNPAPLLNGHDLADLGAAQGPGVARLLERIRDAQLLGELADRETALTLARRLIAEEAG